MKRYHGFRSASRCSSRSLPRRRRRRHRHRHRRRSRHTRHSRGHGRIKHRRGRLILAIVAQLLVAVVGIRNATSAHGQPDGRTTQWARRRCRGRTGGTWCRGKVARGWWGGRGGCREGSLDRGGRKRVDRIRWCGEVAGGWGGASREWRCGVQGRLVRLLVQGCRRREIEQAVVRTALRKNKKRRKNGHEVSTNPELW